MTKQFVATESCIHVRNLLHHVRYGHFADKRVSQTPTFGLVISLELLVLTGHCNLSRLLDLPRLLAGFPLFSMAYQSCLNLLVLLSFGSSIGRLAMFIDG